MKIHLVFKVTGAVLCIALCVLPETLWHRNIYLAKNFQRSLKMNSKIEPEQNQRGNGSTNHCWLQVDEELLFFCPSLCLFNI